MDTHFCFKCLCMHVVPEELGYETVGVLFYITNPSELWLYLILQGEGAQIQRLRGQSAIPTGVSGNRQGGTDQQAEVKDC